MGVCFNLIDETKIVSKKSFALILCVDARLEARDFYGATTFAA